MTLEWRIVESEKASGLWNTLADEVLLEKVEAGVIPPTILFSEWEPTVSIGVNQSFAQDVDASACEKYGVRVVRRKSGGKAVYLHEGYLVFSVIAKRDLIPGEIRETICHAPAAALRTLHVPAAFYPPDNIIVKEGLAVRTIGNAAQHMKPSAFFMHGSIRYEHSYVDVLLDILKVEGRKLQPYAEQIQNILGAVTQYNPYSTKQDIKREFMRNFIQSMPNASCAWANLTAEEKKTIDVRVAAAQSNAIVDEPHFISKGVCYFFLGKENLLPELYRTQTVQGGTRG